MHATLDLLGLDLPPGGSTAVVLPNWERFKVAKNRSNELVISSLRKARSDQRPSAGDQIPRVRWETNLAGILTEFVHLDVAARSRSSVMTKVDPAKVVRFADKHGQLSICQRHLRPRGSHPRCGEAIDAPVRVATWQEFVHRYSAALRILGALRWAGEAADEDLEILRVEGRMTPAQRLGVWVNARLREVEMRPVLAMSRKRPNSDRDASDRDVRYDLRLAALNNLCAALALGMAYFLTAPPRETHRCDACLQVFRPSTKRRTHRGAERVAIYCDREECKSEGLRRKLRRKRARRKNSSGGPLT